MSEGKAPTFERVQSVLTPEQEAHDLAELKEAFQLFDHDGNGSLSIEEIEKVLKAMNKNFKRQDLHATVKKFDDNGDGEIDFSEFLRMMKSDHDDRDELLSAFRVFDLNRDGRISAAELFIICNALGADLDRKTIDLMIESVDTDGDGSIDVEEFRTMMHDGPPVFQTGQLTQMNLLKPTQPSE